jgi:hypothetical protein
LAQWMGSLSQWLGISSMAERFILLSGMTSTSKWELTCLLCQYCDKILVVSLLPPLGRCAWKGLTYTWPYIFENASSFLSPDDICWRVTILAWL